MFENRFPSVQLLVLSRLPFNKTKIACYVINKTLHDRLKILFSFSNVEKISHSFASLARLSLEISVFTSWKITVASLRGLVMSSYQLRFLGHYPLTPSSLRLGLEVKVGVRFRFRGGVGWSLCRNLHWPMATLYCKLFCYKIIYCLGRATL